MNQDNNLIKKGNILLVDDTPYNLQILSVILRKKGYQVSTALNGLRALNTVENYPPDLILLDVMMPEMDGYQVCEKLKASEKTRSIPVIFISALDNVSDKVKAFEFGGVDYISKPFQELEVLARVQTHLMLQKQHNELEEKQINLEKTNAQLKEEILHRKNLELTARLAKKKLQFLFKSFMPNLINDGLSKKQLLIPEKFNSVTILCLDVVNIESLSKIIEPIEIVDYFDKLFSILDRLSEGYGFDKVKIIEDAYMVVAGVPNPSRNRITKVAQMALEMQTSIAEFKLKNGESFQMRIGIHTGAVIAGLLGNKQFIYDLWGDTVDVAVAIESTAEPGKIQVTADVYDRLKDDYLLEKRGNILIKGEREITTYWLKGNKLA